MTDPKLERKKTKKLIILVAFGFLLVNGFSFLNLDGSSLPLPSTLFNMIFFLTLIIFLLYRNDLDLTYEAKEASKEDN